MSRVSPQIERMADPAESSAQPGSQVSSRCASPAPALRAGRLTQHELAVVAASLRELGRRLDRFRARVDALEAAVQFPPGRTSRSTRDSRSAKRSRSS